VSLSSALADGLCAHTTFKRTFGQVGPGSVASKPVEAVVAANPATLFQIYWLGSRETTAAGRCSSIAATVIRHE
jgi:hypothetical protein